MMQLSRLLRLAAFVVGLGFLAIATTGCGGGSDRLELSGTITFEGKPLDRGIIMFTPANQDLSTQASAIITNGKYLIPKAQGLVPGKYLVSISSADGKTPEPGGDALPGPSGNFSSKDRIPAKYNTNTTLEYEMVAGKENKFDFTIP